MAFAQSLTLHILQERMIRHCTLLPLRHPLLPENKRCLFFGLRAKRIVGNIIHPAAKPIERLHGMAACTR